MQRCANYPSGAQCSACVMQMQCCLTQAHLFATVVNTFAFDLHYASLIL